jgi:phosphoribosyl 1,2-cyclic phosphodiesterase
MKLQVLNSNSSGNCYLLISDKNEILIIEAGVRLNSVKKALDFDLSGIEGLIASHGHQDHFKFAKDYLNAGIKIFTSKEAILESGIKSYNFVPVTEKVMFTAGTYSILPFDVVHDCKCFGYVINHKEMGTIVFITDTHYCPYSFKNLNNILIEANYKKEILDQNVDRGITHFSIRNRVIKSHMEIERTKDFLSANDLSKINNIVLIHLSDSASDENLFKSEIENLTCKTVHIAKPGLNISFNKIPF